MRIDYHEHAEITRPMGALSAAATADTLEPALLELVKDSLCGRPDELGAWRIAVLREQSGTGGSKYVYEALRPGMTIRVRGRAITSRWSIQSITCLSPAG